MKYYATVNDWGNIETIESDDRNEFLNELYSRNQGGPIITYKGRKYDIAQDIVDWEEIVK